jgi:lysine 2,3-aminomutase
VANPAEKGVRQLKGGAKNNWRETLRSSFVSLQELTEKFSLDPAEIMAVAGRYPLRITRHYFDLITREGDPVWKQAVPDVQELLDQEQLDDPLNEHGLSPVPGLIHRYPDRVVWLVSNACAVYCRFCMRKRCVGCQGGEIAPSDYDDALRYIRETPAIRDVILSGGDPLLCDDDLLEHILASLRRIPHVGIIRIGTRIPVTFPERVTDALCSIIKRYHPVYLNTHFNHPVEITPASGSACAMLADAGVPLGNQTVLLAGVNDDASIMAELFSKLLTIRVKPYYLHQMDLVKGTAHFRTTIETGLEIMARLRGYRSGLAVPYYVVDLPEGKGKVPLLPGESHGADGNYHLRAYTGEIVTYRD